MLRRLGEVDRAALVVLEGIDGCITDALSDSFKELLLLDVDNLVDNSRHEQAKSSKISSPVRVDSFKQKSKHEDKMHSLPEFV
jgi:hypothetical protein